MASRVFRLLAVAATMIGAAAVAVPPASAANNYFGAATWAYTDSAAPDSPFVNPTGDAPVGARVDADGTVHSTRSYFTYDLSRFVGGTVSTAEIFTDETSVTDCAKARTEQVWLTATDTAPTWANPPLESVQLPGPLGVPETCPSPRLAWDASKVVQDALAAGRTTVTFELRLPDGDQTDPALFRQFDRAPGMYALFNHPPAKPTGAQVDLQACGANPVMVGIGDASPLIITPTDPDNDALTLDFAWWPVDHPEQVTTTTTGVTLPSGMTQNLQLAHAKLADGTTYAWHARASDGQTTGPWSDDCRFTTDFTKPPAPTVSSVDYPTGVTAGGSGIPGTFTLSGNGDPDVVGFRYTFNGVTVEVAPDHPGGTATVQLTPGRVGANALSVSSVDPARNPSATTGDYAFSVTDNAPTVTCSKVDYVGQPRTCVVTPQDKTSVGYTYQVNSGAAVDLAPGPDGTATFTVTPTDPLRSTRVQVRSRLANGNLTDATTASLSVRNGMPTVDQSAQSATVGSTVQFTVHSGLPGSTTFTYTWGFGDPVTVPVGSDGVATLPLVVDLDGFEELDVYSTTPAGVHSAPATAYVSVDQQ
ncbi:hypothetical protein [Kutzneria sp. NPDC052558]|uniref:hypothetical protein n=1 Tax=Kutzneria sp. NPDC052558 TaxID=3364121 RepID=UPI0037C986BD